MATNPDLTDGASQGRGGPAAADLMTRARNGDKQAWDALVERYAPLIWSICRQHCPFHVSARSAAVRRVPLRGTGWPGRRRGRFTVAW